MPRFVLSALIAAVALALAGCDQLGIESPEKIAAARTAEGAAIGGACRHAGRAIEDCYTLNKKADKSAVFAGWRDMNDYMRENKIEAVSPELENPVERLSSKAAPIDAVEATIPTETQTANAPKDATEAAH